MGQISGFNTDPELNIHNDPITPDEEALGKMEETGQKDTEAYQKLRKVWMELSE